MKIKVKCVQCKEEKWLYGEETKREDTPFCAKCYMPMVVREVRSEKGDL